MERSTQPGRVGNTDRAVRIAIGIVFVTLAMIPSFAVSFGVGVVFSSALVGGALILTAGFRFCPLYRLLGIST